jgi:hypothetical protein
LGLTSEQPMHFCEGKAELFPLAARLSALRGGHALLRRNIFWYSFLIVAEPTPALYSAAGTIR